MTLRVPSDSRAIWTMRSMAEAICWRTAVSGRLQVGHRHHRVEAIQRVARAVGVDRRQAAVVAGVHGLQHVQRLVAADLADDDAIGPHAQGVDDQLALRDRALALDVRRPRLQPDDVPLPQHQLGGVLDGDDALAFRDEAGQHVEQRRLAGAGAAARRGCSAGWRRPRRRKSSIGGSATGGRPGRAPPSAIGPEPADREHGPSSASGGMMALTREPSGSRASTIGLDSSMRRPTELTMRSMICIRCVSSRNDRGALLELALALDVDLVVAVDQDVRDVRVGEQRFERPEAEQLVEDVDDHRSRARRG